MIVGVPKEIKVQEYRVGLVPSGVRTLRKAGHKVLVEKGAGIGSGIPDQAYVDAGAEIRRFKEEVWQEADMIVKVKEPLATEYDLFKEGLIIYTYLHLAAVPELTKTMLDKGVIGIGYETIQLGNGSLPLLVPMSEIAGKMSIQVGANCLEKEKGGKGVLLGGVPGVHRGIVTIIGAGVVGTNAAKIAVGMGAEVKILDTRLDRLSYLDDIFETRVTTLYSDIEAIERSVMEADLVVGAVLIPGASAPRLVSRDLISRMAPGSVVVDVSVDQGGCIETCHPTTHENPTFEEAGVVHYCVANMPGAVARTSTFALTNVTTPYAVMIANCGFVQAIQNPALAKGVQIKAGKVTHPAVAESLGYAYSPLH